MVFFAANVSEMTGKKRTEAMWIPLYCVLGGALENCVVLE